MKIIEKVLSVVLGTMAFTLEIVVEFTENAKFVLKFMFEMVLFILLLVTCPLWVLPYVLIMKHKEKKNESEDNK